jgi:hypothetical protein
MSFHSLCCFLPLTHFLFEVVIPNTSHFVLHMRDKLCLQGSQAMPITRVDVGWGVL